MEIAFKDLNQWDKNTVIRVEEHWFEAQKVLRNWFKLSLNKKCKTCNNCCCRSCKGGYFYEDSNFNRLMFEAKELKIPNKDECFYDEKNGCKMPEGERSFTCVMYNCGSDLLFISYKQLWSYIKDRLIYNLRKDSIKPEDRRELYLDTIDLLSVEYNIRSIILSKIDELKNSKAIKLNISDEIIQLGEVKYFLKKEEIVEQMKPKERIKLIQDLTRPKAKEQKLKEVLTIDQEGVLIPSCNIKSVLRIN